MHMSLLQTGISRSYYNMTVYPFRFPDNPDGQTNEYLLKINSSYTERAIDHHNNDDIDARWVDMTNGAYIDITAVHLLDPHIQVNNKPLFWQTKEGHLYEDVQLYPLRCIVFEGVPTYVPHEAETLCAKEYSENALTLDMFNGNHLDSTGT